MSRGGFEILRAKNSNNSTVREADLTGRTPGVCVGASALFANVVTIAPFVLIKLDPDLRGELYEGEN